MSYVFHADTYKVEDALGWYTGKRCATCGTPMVRDPDFSTDHNRCLVCSERRKAARVSMRKCELCGGLFKACRSSQRFCSMTCAGKHRMTAREAKCH